MQIHFSRERYHDFLKYKLRKQCICIHKYQNLLGVMPQPPRTVMEHHRLYTMERKHFLVQKIIFIDFHKLHQAHYKSGRLFSPKHLPLLCHSSQLFVWICFSASCCTSSPAEKPTLKWHSLSSHWAMED